jgi:hypothetical protein
VVHNLSDGPASRAIWRVELAVVESGEGGPQEGRGSSDVLDAGAALTDGASLVERKRTYGKSRIGHVGHATRAGEPPTVLADIGPACYIFATLFGFTVPFACLNISMFV